MLNAGQKDNRVGSRNVISDVSLGVNCVHHNIGVMNAPIWSGIQFIASKLQMNFIKPATIILHVGDISSFELLSYSLAVTSWRLHRLMRLHCVLILKSFM